MYYRPSEFRIALQPIKKLTTMSQLSGLNQPQALTNANNNKEISATSAKPSIANVSVTPGLMATFTISNSGLSIQQQLTMQQAQNL